MNQRIILSSNCNTMRDLLHIYKQLLSRLNQRWVPPPLAISPRVLILALALLGDIQLRSSTILPRNFILGKVERRKPVKYLLSPVMFFLFKNHFSPPFNPVLLLNKPPSSPPPTHLSSKIPNQIPRKIRAVDGFKTPKKKIFQKETRKVKNPKV